MEGGEGAHGTTLCLTPTVLHLVVMQEKLSDAALSGAFVDKAEQALISNTKLSLPQVVKRACEEHFPGQVRMLPIENGCFVVCMYVCVCLVHSLCCGVVQLWIGSYNAIDKRWAEARSFSAVVAFVPRTVDGLHAAAEKLFPWAVRADGKSQFDHAMDTIVADRRRVGTCARPPVAILCCAYLCGCW